MAMAEAVQSASAATKQRNLEPYKFQPGQSGNPKGRKPGSRNKLADQFIHDLHDEWQAHGAETLSKARKADPVAFIKVVAGLLPKDINLNVSAAERFGQIIEHIEQQAGVTPALPQPGAEHSQAIDIIDVSDDGPADCVSAAPKPTPEKAQD